MAKSSKKTSTLFGKPVGQVIRRPGRLRAAAKKANAITDDGNIDPQWLKDQARGGGSFGAAAELALRMRSWKKG